MGIEDHTIDSTFNLASRGRGLPVTRTIVMVQREMEKRTRPLSCRLLLI